MTLKVAMKASAKKAKNSKAAKTATPSKADIQSYALKFTSEYDLNQTKVGVFVDTLLKIHEGKKSGQVDAVSGEKKSQLFGVEETPIKLQIAGIKLPKEGRKHLIKIVLPHSPLVDSKDICIFTKDLEKGLKVDHESTVNHFKEHLASKGVEAASIVSLRELKVEYKPYEAKTALCHRHEAFLADERIVRLLPKFLGKPFYSRKKFPNPINLDANDLPKEVDKATRTVILPLEHKGACSMLKVGHSSMKRNHLIDNILQATEILAKQYPGGWKNIRSIHLKTETSMSIPIHLSDISPNELGFVDSNAPKPPKKEPIVDELSTIPDAKVTIMPDFSVKVEGGIDADDINDSDEDGASDEEKDNDDEDAQPKAKKPKLDKKKVAKGKKNKKDESSDEEDKEIEQAEHDYITKNALEDDKTEEENKLEGAEEDNDEEDDDEEEEDEEEEEEEEEELPVVKPVKAAKKPEAKKGPAAKKQVANKKASPVSKLTTKERTASRGKPIKDKTFSKTKNSPIKSGKAKASPSKKQKKNVAAKKTKK